MMMPVLARISFRNLLEHKTKSLIIGTIIAVGIVVIIVGNALMDTAALGIQRGFIDNYTGDIMVAGYAENDVSLFGIQSPGGIEETPTLPKHDTIRDYLRSRDEVANTTSQVTGYSQLRFGELEGRSFTIVFGIEPSSYREMFGNISFIEGRDLLPGEEGIVLSKERLDDLVEAVVDDLAKKAEREEKNEAEESTIDTIELLDAEDFEIHVGDELRLTSFGNAGIKIRSVPLVGVFEFLNPSEGLGIDLISYVDIQTVRALNGLTIGFQGEFELTGTQTELLDLDDLDDLFSDDIEVSESEISKLDESSLDTILGDTSVRDAALEVDTGAWQYILVKVKGRSRLERVIASINDWFSENGIAAEAVNWEGAAGPFAQTADVIRRVFNVAIIIVGLVAIIIMINTLVISVIERTSEIGTMRALGARKLFVWKMFLVETFTITSVFGIVGVLLSLLIVGVLNIIGIPATNVFLRVLFAGESLHPVVSFGSVISALLIATTVGLLAHIYPVSVALKIQPVKAIQTE